MTKVWDWIKKWGWAVIVGILSLLALGRTPSWVKQKEQEIKQRDKEIETIKDEREKIKHKGDEIKDSLPDFEKVVKEQDDKIAEAGKHDKPDPLTDPHDIADFIKERAGRE